MPESPGNPASTIGGSRGNPASDTPASVGPVDGPGELEPAPEPEPEPGRGAPGAGDDGDGDGAPGCAGAPGCGEPVGGEPGAPGCGEPIGGAPGAGWDGDGCEGAGCPGEGAGAAGDGAPDGAGVIGCDASSIAPSAPPANPREACGESCPDEPAGGAASTLSTPASVGISVLGPMVVIGLPPGSVGSGRGATGVSPW